MPLRFEWDPEKARKNLDKHQVSFPEAVTVFGDPLSMTFYDPDHSVDEERYVTIGHSDSGQLLMVAIQIEAPAFESSVRESQLVARENPIKSNNDIQADTVHPSDDELRPEYDLSQLQGGVRGKYAQRYKQGTNLVLLAPDVADAFPTEDSVNEALRLLIRIAETQLAHRVQT
jgi:uncharacterized DUF497 family protein